MGRQEAKEWSSMSEEQKSQSINSAVSNLLEKQHSPTGEAQLPQWAVRLGLALVTTAGVLQLAFLPGSAWDVGCRVIIALGAAFGIASQGVRK